MQQQMVTADIIDVQPVFDRINTIETVRSAEPSKQWDDAGERIEGRRKVERCYKVATSRSSTAWRMSDSTGLIVRTRPPLLTCTSLQARSVESNELQFGIHRKQQGATLERPRDAVHEVDVTCCACVVRTHDCA